LASQEFHPETGWDIFLLTHDRARTLRPLIQTPFNEVGPSFSPDGHWLAYASDESGRMEVYLRPFPGLGAKWQISTDGGVDPRWQPDGQGVFYKSNEEDKIMAVALQTQPAAVAEAPRQLFGASVAYDVAPDGRVVAIQSAQAESVTEITLVQNWFEELTRSVPSGR
jgi:Tol biopolymer transport system component